MYNITEEVLHKAVTSCTKNLMAGQREWRKDRDLDMLEWKIEEAIVKAIQGYHGISIEGQVETDYDVIV